CPEGQESVVWERPERDARLAVGSRIVVTRRVGRGEVPTTEVVAELCPPKSWGSRGVGGIPVTGVANGTIEPLDDGKRSRVTFALDSKGTESANCWFRSWSDGRHAGNCPGTRDSSRKYSSGMRSQSWLWRRRSK